MIRAIDLSIPTFTYLGLPQTTKLLDVRGVGKARTLGTLLPLKGCLSLWIICFQVALPGGCFRF